MGFQTSGRSPVVGWHFLPFEVFVQVEERAELVIDVEASGAVFSFLLFEALHRPASLNFKLF